MSIRAEKRAHRICSGVGMAREPDSLANTPACVTFSSDIRPCYGLLLALMASSPFEVVVAKSHAVERPATRADLFPGRLASLARSRKRANQIGNHCTLILRRSAPHSVSTRMASL